jgi:hypothetical protein
MLRADRHARGEAEARIDRVAGGSELARHRDQVLAAGAALHVLGQLAELFSERNTLGNLVTHT